jgi:dTDP-D-glucose 4,6-dehydratase
VLVYNAGSRRLFVEIWLITGGAGFIGCNFVRLVLRETAARVVILDKLTYAGNLDNLGDVLADARVTFVAGDIADPRPSRRCSASTAPRPS